METRARYLLIGLFALSVMAAGFGFVYWLNNAAGLAERAAYRVRFTSAVPGLRPGSSVLFNGIRVGEVTALTLSPNDPREVMATIMVERSTPIRADTFVSVETQGLMAAPSITLRGGAPDAEPIRPAAAGQSPVLAAEAAAGTDTMALARDVLKHIDQVVVENAEPLRDTIASLRIFSEALARNSGKIDTLLEALERMTGAGPAKLTPALFDLVAPQTFPDIGAVPEAQLAIMEPTAVLALDTQRILTRGADAPSFPDAQWTDSIPKLVHERLVQSFENAKFARVARPFEGFAQDFRLLIDLREFWIDSEKSQAHVGFGAKLVDSGGRVIATKLFSATEAPKDASVTAAVAALNGAFGRTSAQLVSWVATAM